MDKSRTNLTFKGCKMVLSKRGQEIIVHSCISHIIPLKALATLLVLFLGRGKRLGNMQKRCYNGMERRRPPKSKRWKVD